MSERVVLASPPLSLEARYGKLRGAGNSLPGLGLLYLAAAARRAGYPVAIVDSSACTMNLEEAASAILANAPTVVGLSATTLGVWAAAELAARLKLSDPTIKMVMGGPHATALPESTLQRFAAIDAVVIGEGEQVLLEVLEACRTGSRLSDVPGVVARGAGGQIERGAPSGRIGDLDTLAPPAWDLLEGFPRRFSPASFRFRKLPAASLVTSRGCPFNCSFCDKSIFGGKVRFHSVDYLLELIADLWKRGVREILFEDDMFTANRKRVARFCEALLQRGTGLSWSCLARVGSVDEKLLRLMRRAGCWQISYGIESGDTAILERMGKPPDLELVKERLQVTRRAGIRSKGFFILGYPGETPESLERTARFALSLALDDISVSLFTPFPGSPIYESVRELGTFEEDWQRMNLLDVVFIPRALTKATLKQAHARLLREFYLRPRVVWSYLLRAAQSPRAIPAFARGALSLIASSVLAGPNDL